MGEGQKDRERERDTGSRSEGYLLGGTFVWEVIVESSLSGMIAELAVECLLCLSELAGVSSASGVK